MGLEERHKNMVLCVFFGCVIFIIGTILAMFFYPGGNVENPEAPQYDFVRNFFSDLGHTKSRNGESNIIPLVLFSLSAMIAGFCLIPFFLAMPAFFEKSKGERIWSRMASGFAMPISIAYIGIGLSPADLYPFLHGVFVFIAFTGTVPIVLIYTVLIIRNPLFPPYISYVYGFFLMVTFAYMLIIYIVADSLVFQVVAQKIVIYTEMGSMAISGRGIAKVVEKELQKKT
jgi:hypothetical membrane protein